jgi:hypothetical protein
METLERNFAPLFFFTRSCGRRQQASAGVAGGNATRAKTGLAPGSKPVSVDKFRFEEAAEGGQPTE